MYKISLTKVHRAVFSLKAADVTNAPQHRTNKSIDQSNSSFPRYQTASWHLHVAEWHGGEEMLRRSTAAMRCQTPRCEENKPVNQRWQSLRGTLTTLFYCVANTEEISFIPTSFVCIYLNVNMTQLVLLYYSLSDDLLPRMNHLWGDLYSKKE